MRARHALLATSAFPPLVRAIRRYVVPVYDYVLVTEPLSQAQRDAIGWHGRQGLSDLANQFHYYRQTDDHRILWGGYDAIYDFGGRVAPERDQRPATFELLAEHFFDHLPAARWAGLHAPLGRRDRHVQPLLGDVGPRARRARGLRASGSPASASGASRFGARVGLDLLDGLDTERTRLEMVRRRPFPFPPEPARWAVIQLTQRALARADARAGRRGPWLRTLDRLGLGFDS